MIPDRSHLLTEQRNPRSMKLHTLSVRECVDLINAEDQRAVKAVAAAGDAVAEFIEATLPRFELGGRLIYIGAGTSGRLGVMDAAEAPPTFQVEASRIVGVIAGGDAALRKSSEGLEDDPRGAVEELNALHVTPRDTVLGIAAGGTTPYVLGALEHVKRSAMDAPGATGGRDEPTTGVERRWSPLTGLLVCAPIDPPSFVDHLIVVETGAEVLTGSTRMKAGTATKLVLNAITTTVMVRSGRVYENLMVDVRATNNKLRDRAARIVGALTGLAREAAFGLIDRAGGSVKSAVVMHKTGLPRAAADALIARSHGRLDVALGETPEPAPTKRGRVR
ncbi:MAG: N-acetylmuramic acid 6-phosphate etherase [Phycisphaerales bacterium]